MYEFKNDKGLLGLSFYPIFLARRLAYVFSQVLMNDSPIVQVSVNVVFTIVQLFHLLIYRPFKERSVFISELIGEVCTLIVFLTTSLLLRTNSDSEIHLIEDITVYTVLATFSLQIFITFYCFVIAVIRLYKKLERIRAFQFQKSAHAMHSLDILK